MEGMGCKVIHEGGFLIQENKKIFSQFSLYLIRSKFIFFLKSAWRDLQHLHACSELSDGGILLLYHAR
jgi:hypothetical protein